MEIAMLIMAIIGLISTLGTSAYQGIVAKSGSEVRAGILGTAAMIARKIANNNALLSQFQQAYQTKNTEMINELFKGMGFGPRAAKLRSDISENEKEYRSIMRDINKQNTELDVMNTKLNNATMNTGTSITGNKAATSATQEVQKELEKTADLTQNINGGAINAQI